MNFGGFASGLAATYPGMLEAQQQLDEHDLNALKMLAARQNLRQQQASFPLQQKLLAAHANYWNRAGAGGYGGGVGGYGGGPNIFDLLYGNSVPDGQVMPPPAQPLPPGTASEPTRPMPPSAQPMSSIPGMPDQPAFPPGGTRMGMPPQTSLAPPLPGSPFMAAPQAAPFGASPAAASGAPPAAAPPPRPMPPSATPFSAAGSGVPPRPGAAAGPGSPQPPGPAAPPLDGGKAYYDSLETIIPRLRELGLSDTQIHERLYTPPGRRGGQPQLRADVRQMMTEQGKLRAREGKESAAQSKQAAAQSKQAEKAAQAEEDAGSIHDRFEAMRQSNFEAAQEMLSGGEEPANIVKQLNKNLAAELRDIKTTGKISEAARAALTKETTEYYRRLITALMGKGA